MIRYTESDNMPRWDRRRRGWFETYYLKFNDPARQLGWWLRYTFLFPKGDGQAPQATLWGYFFDKSNPSRNFSLRENVLLDATKLDPEIFFVQIGEAALYTIGARGKLAGGGHRLEWDLKFDTEGISSRLLPALFYASPWPPTKFVSPYFDTHISGTVIVDGETLSLSHIKGHQGHLWGTDGAPSWAWVHCNDFSGEEGVAVEMLSAPVAGTEKTLLHLRLPNRDVKASNLMLPGRLMSCRDPHEWVVEVPRGKEKIVVKASRDPVDCHVAENIYPDGSMRQVTNSSVADCEVILFQKNAGAWIEQTRYFSKSAAAFETGAGA